MEKNHSDVSKNQLPWCRREIVFLFLVTLLAAVLRLWGGDYGLGNLQARSDEEFIIRQAVSIVEGDFLSMDRFFLYPTLIPLTLAGLIGALKLLGADPLFLTSQTFVLDPAPLTALARALFVSFSIASVPALYFAARRFFSRRAAAWSALFLSVSMLAVREGHFAKLTSPALFFFVLLPGSSLYILYKNDNKSHFLAGLLWGLGISAFYTVVFAGAGFLAAILHRDGIRRFFSQRSAALAGGAVVGFLVGTPFLLLAPRAFIETTVFYRFRYMYIGAAQDVVVGPRGYGLIHHPIFTLRHGIGLPLLAVCLLALLFLVVKSFKKDGRAWVLLAAILPYYFVFGTATDLYVRYMVPLLPPLFLAASWFLDEKIFSNRTGWRRSAAFLTILLLCLPPFLSSLELDLLLGRKDTRLIAAEWMETNLPSGSRVYMYPSPGNPEPNPNRLDLIRRPFASSEKLLAANPDVIVVEEYPFLIFSEFPPALASARQERYPRLLWSISPLEENAEPADLDPLFDPQDNFYLPYANMEGFARGGPMIFLYGKPIAKIEN